VEGYPESRERDVNETQRAGQIACADREAQRSLQNPRGRESVIFYLGTRRTVKKSAPTGGEGGGGGGEASGLHKWKVTKTGGIQMSRRVEVPVEKEGGEAESFEQLRLARGVGAGPSESDRS